MKIPENTGSATWEIFLKVAIFVKNVANITEKVLFGYSRVSFQK